MKDEIKRADIVMSTAGRDKGRLMFVLSVLEGGTLLLADGKCRKVEKKKKKKEKHAELFERSENPVSRKILSGEVPLNKEIRRELARRQLDTTSQGG